MQVPILVGTPDFGAEIDETVNLTLSRPSRGYKVPRGTLAVLTIHEMPAPPVPVLTTPIAADPVVLSWTETAHQFETVSFRVLRTDDPPGTTDRIYDSLAGALTTKSYTDNGVTAGVRYYYKVQAQNVDGAYSTSNEVSVRVPFPAPPDITSITATAKTTPFVGIQVDWTGSAPVPDGVTVYYRIWRGTTPAVMSVLVDVYAPVMTYTDSIYGAGKLVSGTTYYYRVLAFNADGISGGTATLGSAIAP